MAVIKYWSSTDFDWVPVATVGGSSTGISKLKTEKVDSLPSSGMDPATIYLVPCENADGDDQYDEYMFVDGAWERFGTRDSAVETIENSYADDNDIIGIM